MSDKIIPFTPALNKHAIFCNAPVMSDEMILRAIRTLRRFDPVHLGNVCEAIANELKELEKHA